MAVLAEEEADRDHKERVEDQNVEHQPVEDLGGLIATELCLIRWGTCGLLLGLGLNWIHRVEVNGLAVKQSGHLEDNEHRPAEAGTSLLLNGEHAQEVDDCVHEVAGHGEPEGSLDATAVVGVVPLYNYGPSCDTQEHQHRHQVEDPPLSAMGINKFLILVVILVLSIIEELRGLFNLLAIEVLGLS